MTKQEKITIIEGWLERRLNLSLPSELATENEKQINRIVAVLDKLYA